MLFPASRASDRRILSETDVISSPPLLLSCWCNAESCSLPVTFIEKLPGCPARCCSCFQNIRGVSLLQYLPHRCVIVGGLSSPPALIKPGAVLCHIAPWLGHARHLVNPEFLKYEQNDKNGYLLDVWWVNDAYILKDKGRQDFEMLNSELPDI